MRRDSVPFSAEVLLLCAIFGSIFALVLSGCGRPVDASPPAFVIEKTPSPSCPCGDKCECGELKKEVERLKGEVANKNTTIAKKEAEIEVGADMYAELADDKRFRVGDKMTYDSGSEWEVKWVNVKQAPQYAAPAKRITIQKPQGRRRGSCGTNGCPTF